jgi:hypothetical protein
VFGEAVSALSELLLWILVNRAPSLGRLALGFPELGHADGRNSEVGKRLRHSTNFVEALSVVAAMDRSSSSRDLGFLAILDA